MQSIDSFIKDLSVQPVSTETTNIYRGKSGAARIRRANLRLYLQTMERIQPNTLLLGEAPGYKGCRITGVPFTSERVLTEVSFFKDQGYQCLHQPDQLESEISATIVWKELARYSDKPLIWNIFPFHPHASNDQRSNRPPNKQELEIGTHFLIALLAIFPVEKIIALGRKAESQIKKLGYEYAYVRHPARGGKNKFMAGLRTAY